MPLSHGISNLPSTLSSLYLSFNYSLTPRIFECSTCSVLAYMEESCTLYIVEIHTFHLHHSLLHPLYIHPSYLHPSYLHNSPCTLNSFVACAGECSSCSVSTSNVETCTTCNIGWVLKSSASCDFCPLHCSSCTSTTACSNCDTDAVMVAGVCQGV